MSLGVIHTPHRTISGSKLIETLANSLSTIRTEDGLTDKEVGGFLGKGQDAGKAYRTGFAEMPFTSLLRGIERWNGRFCNDTFALIGMKVSPLAVSSGAELQTKLARLMLELSEASAHGTVDELSRQRMKRSLIEVGEAVDALRGAA